MGAIARNGVRVLNQRVIEALRIPDWAIDTVAAREQIELGRRERAYRADRPAREVEGRTVILVDDGIATGSTMRVAVEALRKLKVGRVVVGMPTAALDTAPASRWANPPATARACRGIAPRRPRRRAPQCVEENDDD